MPGIFPPISTPLMNPDNERLTKGWESFFTDIHNTMGNNAGNLFFDKDTVKVDGLNKNLNIGNGSNFITLNGFVWDASPQTGEVLVSDPDQQLDFLAPEAVFTTYEPGDIVFSYRVLSIDNWIALNDGTIGNESSGGTSRANTDCRDLFFELWNNTLDTHCPVSTGRGPTAEFDWDDNKTIALPKMLGRAAGAAGTGSGLTARALGESLGEETHVLELDEIRSHEHGMVVGQTVLGDGEPGGSVYPIGRTSAVGNFGAQQNFAVTTDSTGGDVGHDNVQPAFTVMAYIKL